MERIWARQRFEIRNFAPHIELYQSSGNLTRLGFPNRAKLDHKRLAAFALQFSSKDRASPCQLAALVCVKNPTRDELRRTGRYCRNCSRLLSSSRRCRRILCTRKVECVGSSGLELLQPLWFTTRRNEWVSLDPGSAVLIKTCFKTPESRCAPVEWYPQPRSFPSDF